MTRRKYSLASAYRPASTSDFPCAKYVLPSEAFGLALRLFDPRSPACEGELEPLELQLSTQAFIASGGATYGLPARAGSNRPRANDNANVRSIGDPLPPRAPARELVSDLALKHLFPTRPANATTKN